MSEIRDAIDYAKSLIGVPYVWWDGKNIPVADVAPFYVCDSSPPTNEFVRMNGCCCTGLINLMRRRVELEIPKSCKYPGGTGAWLSYLKRKRMLKPYNSDEKYPGGTLLVRPYDDYSDQGHVAVLLDDGNVIHCYPDDPTPSPGFHSPGVTITPVLDDYYKYQCSPEKWLVRDSKKRRTMKNNKKTKRSLAEKK